MSLHLHFFTHHCHFSSLPNPSLSTFPKFHSLSASCRLKNGATKGVSRPRPATRRRLISSTKTAFHPAISASLDLTEDNIKQVLVDARTETYSSSVVLPKPMPWPRETQPASRCICEILRPFN
nr:uncharacterized protein LOC109150536 [Ipomoea batatas]